MYEPLAGAETERMFAVNVLADNLQPGIPSEIVVVPQLAFKPERLVVADEYKDATLHSIRVDDNEQLVSAVPCAALSPGAIGAIMAPVSPGAQIVVTVSHPRGGKFEAAFIGTAVGAEPLVETAQEALKILLGEDNGAID